MCSYNGLISRAPSSSLSFVYASRSVLFNSALYLSCGAISSFSSFSSLSSSGGIFSLSCCCSSSNFVSLSISSCFSLSAYSLACSSAYYWSNTSCGFIDSGYSFSMFLNILTLCSHNHLYASLTYLFLHVSLFNAFLL
jgi:hypothetical protein